jgi:hypothetical protein
MAHALWARAQASSPPSAQLPTRPRLPLNQGRRSTISLNALPFCIIALEMWSCISTLQFLSPMQTAICRVVLHLADWGQPYCGLLQSGEMLNGCFRSGFGDGRKKTGVYNSRKCSMTAPCFVRAPTGRRHRRASTWEEWPHAVACPIPEHTAEARR